MNDDFVNVDDLEENDEKVDELLDDSGEGAVSGSAPATTSDDDTGEALADVIGNEPEAGKPFFLADEVGKDEMERRGMDPKDYGLDDE